MDYLKIILQAVITVVVPLLTGFIVSFIKAKRDSIASTSDNTNIRNIIYTVSDIVQDVVAYVSQTYVDALKKSGEFSVENQKMAFQMAYERAVQLITEENAAVIGIIFGNFSEWLSTMIEVAVRRQKE